MKRSFCANFDCDSYKRFVVSFMLFRLRCGLSLLFPVCFPSLPKPISAPVTLYSIIVQVEGSVASVDSSSELRMLLHNVAIRNVFAIREQVCARVISMLACSCFNSSALDGFVAGFAYRRRPCRPGQCHCQRVQAALRDEKWGSVAKQRFLSGRIPSPMMSM